MESSVIITAVICLIIGFGVAFLLKSKKSDTNLPSNEAVDSTNNKEVSLLKSTIESLENEKTKLHKKLSDSEELLKTIQESEDISSDSEKLVKDIKKLKDEIDDLEDDIDDLEGKNKKLRSEKSEIEENLDAVEKEKRNLTAEKEELSEKLVAIIKEAEEDNKSLTFVNNILKAKNATDKDMEEIDHKTWDIFSFIEKTVSPYLENHDEKEVNLGEDAWNWRNMEMKTWIKDKKVVAIVGEFSSGKTSIVNRILSQDDPSAALLPTSSKETTAVPTYISKSKDFNCQFYSPDGNLRNIKKETFEMVTKSVLDKVNVSHLIKYFVLSYDNKYLDNISILDTPGFGSNSKEILKKTTDVVKEADVLFWVIDANTGDINQTSIDVMKKDLNKVPLYFIINKSDTKSVGDLEQLEKKIQVTAKNNNIEYKAIIRFSQKENVKVLMEHIKEIEVQKQTRLMKDIAEGLDSLIEEKEQEKKDLIETRNINRENIRIIESNFKIIQGNIVYSVENIRGLVKRKDGWLSGTKYQIDKLDYDDFLKSSTFIENASKNINNEVKSYFENISFKTEIDDDIAINKYQLEKLNNVKKEFTKLIKDYNPNLLN